MKGHKSLLTASSYSKNFVTKFPNSVFLVQFLIFLLCVCNCWGDNTLKGDAAKDLVLSGAEKDALDEFRKQVEHLLPENFMKSEFYLIRWLRISNLNLDEARNLLFKTVKWREKNKIAGILTEDFTDVEHDCPMRFGGVDKEGRPVREMDLGDWDIRSIMLQGRGKRVQRYLDYANEKQFQLLFHSRENNSTKTATRANILINTHGVNLRQHFLCPGCIANILSLYTKSVEHYPEFLGKVVLINALAPAIIIVNAVKPLMNSDMQNRLKIFGTEKNIWMNYLNSQIDPSQRGESYGGTRKV